MKNIYVVLLVILVIIAGVALYGTSRSGALIREAVTTYGPKATGTAVTLNKIRVSLLNGDASLSGLTIGNPPGFKSAYAFKIGAMDVKVDMDSLFGTVVHVKDIRIDGADLIYEIGTNGNNIAAIQKNLEAYANSFGPASATESKSQVRFIIDNINITGTRVKLASDLLGGKAAGLTLPDIHLKNIGTEDKTATAGQVGSVIFGAVNKALGTVVTKGMLDNGLNNGLKKIKKNLGKNTLENVKKKLGDIFK
ncbi:MAG: AsmA family protein [Alphaproteobacteria bacterium]|nr:AsmA family protein [Alphaproteobacteria bacterium]